MLFSKKYRYVQVRFENSNRMYAYRADDRSLKPGDVVIVPTPEGEKCALVLDNRRYTESKVPFPLEQSKSAIRRAHWYERKAFRNAGKTTVYYELDSLKGKFYRCGLCKSIYSTHHTLCPACNARWTKRKYDPTFVDEIETFDAMY